MTTNPPPSRSQLAAQLAALYIVAEQALLGEAASILRRTPADLVSLGAARAAFRRLVRQVLEQLTRSTDALAGALVAAAITEGRRDGEALALQELELAAPGANGGGSGNGAPTVGNALTPDDPFDLSMPHGERAARAIRADLISELQDVRFRITRLPDDIYKAIAAEGAIYQVHDNDVTPAQAQAMAWRVFVHSGVTGFTDRSGRDWSLSAYTEMAIRTAATRAYNASHLARMHALGIHYFTIPRHLGSCPKCFPWQGAVLTDGPVADPAITVDATIAEAVAAGLFHPNCEHTLLPVIPGVTDLPPREVWDADRQAAYDLTQTQRRLELAVRKAKRQLEYAVGPEARAEALRDLRRAQKRVHEFVTLHGLARQSRREQIDLRDDRMKLPTPIRSEHPLDRIHQGPRSRRRPLLHRQHPRSSAGDRRAAGSRPHDQPGGGAARRTHR